MPPPTAASKPSATPARRGRFEELDAVVREERLVGGDHVLAAGERPRDERARGLEAPDELDHDVDRRVREHAAGVTRQRQGLEIEAFTGAGEVGVGHGGQEEARARSLFEHLAPALEDLHDPSADGAEPQQTDAYFARSAHDGSPRVRSAAQLFESAQRLANPLLVLDEREPHVALAVLAEADAR